MSVQQHLPEGRRLVLGQADPHLDGDPVHPLPTTSPWNSEDPLDCSTLPPSWQTVLGPELAKPYFRTLQAFVAEERAQHEVFPPEQDVYTAFHLAPFEAVKVLLLGQDPYHDNHQAHGLCFSVRPGVAIPPSLKNIYKELHSDQGFSPVGHGYLSAWASQGILMLNTVLTVRAHQANSHKNKGWEGFTDAAIQAVNAKSESVVFVLWGAYAQKKTALIDTSRHTIVQSPHPSPLSAKNGFFGSKPFSQINHHLRNAGHSEINWQLPASVVE